MNLAPLMTVLLKQAWKHAHAVYRVLGSSHATAGLDSPNFRQVRIVAPLSGLRSPAARQTCAVVALLPLSLGFGCDFSAMDLRVELRRPLLPQLRLLRRGHEQIQGRFTLFPGFLQYHIFVMQARKPALESTAVSVRRLRWRSTPRSRPRSRGTFSWRAVCRQERLKTCPGNAEPNSTL